MGNPLFYLRKMKFTGGWFISQIAEVVIFAMIYYLLDIMQPNTHFTNLECEEGQPFCHTFTKLCYFSLCIQSTIGYGDIMPKSELARIINMIQIFLVYAGIANFII